MDYLLEAIDRLRDTGVERDGFLANHGPMGAEALVTLGFAKEATGWAQHYRERKQLEQAPPPGVDLGDDWRFATGVMDRLPDWVSTFEKALSGRPWPDVLALWWPRLIPGWAASATHGVIRTAHAVRALSRYPDNGPALLLGELAQGLALWAARYQPLPGNPLLGGDLSAREALRRLPRVPADEPVAGSGISGALARLVRVRGFDAALEEYGGTHDANAALDELIGVAAGVLASHDDAPISFCHAVTGPAAMRLVLPHLPARLHRPTVAAAWHTIGSIVAATSPSSRADGLDREEWNTAEDRTALAERAAEHGDEHVIKLVEASLREHARTGNPVLLHAADKFIGRLRPVR